MFPVKMSLFLVLFICLFTSFEAISILPRLPISYRESRYDRKPVAAVLPGGIVTTTLAQGIATSVGLFSNVILARVVLSFFPQALKQFPVLKPIVTVTEPYLKVFRKRIPKIGNFDISTIPAVIILDVFGQATAALGSEFPQKKMLKKNCGILEKPIRLDTEEKSSRLKLFHTLQ